MITLTFYSTNGGVFHGVVLRRQDNMLEVAMDESASRPASIGWMNPTAQIGRAVVSLEVFRPVHSAIKEAMAGNVDIARDILRREEKQRLEERNKNSH